MRLQKFRAATMRDALAQVRRELGADALVVATRPIRAGLLRQQIEVTAAVEDEGSSAAPAPSAMPDAAPPPSLSEDAIDRVTAPLHSELRSLRSFVKTLAGQRGQDARVASELQALQRLVATIAAGQGTGDEPELSELAARGRLSAPSAGRVVVMVGPTGVGKTTTIAKLAGRAALLDRRRVHIVSLDTYRIGAGAQIDAFGRLIGVPVTVVDRAPQRFADALAAARDADVVLVDTAGRSLRDPRGVGELARVLRGVSGLEVHLAIAAGTSRVDIDAIARRHAGLPVHRLVFTKVDETAALQELVRTPARLSIPVSFVTTGQRIPEDLEVAGDARLLALATSGLPLAEVA